ncbi:ATP-dependent RNA helicase DDX24 [Acyrthosiphon pisum]|uniref:ATP-dependent RNA helicase n=1 Tax=Acyrthosiphon pisum TaxID=7029 RepID=A0A8R2B6A5_ACYPI|nr:ATP-dependent RNA helicase DDX24 [Acyrthosiphon pisum]|eukprot:XP_008183874.1 PREDICTED: ATP-dependent RNA helicase DDX24-like [Acyrthosiphon pisum]
MPPESSYLANVRPPYNFAATLFYTVSSPMFSSNSHGQLGAADIRTEILNALKLKNFTKPTKIQSESIPPAINDQRDILGAAETGSGKTLAFAYPILNGILNGRSTGSVSDDSDLLRSQTLSPTRKMIVNQKSWKNSMKTDFILVPTRELAMQVKKHIEDVAKFTDISIAAIVGGLSSEKQERILKKGPEIVVATPGRLWEMVQRNEPHLMQLNKVKYFVIDEADRMVETAHFPELHLMLEKINLKKNNKRQNFVFSATLTMVHKAPYRINIKNKKKVKKNLTPDDKLKSLIQLIGMKNPHVVNLTTVNCVTSTVKEMQIFCSVKEKDGYLYYFLKRNPGRSLFGVNHVIHYDVPETAEIYIHRSGRTARASNIGLSLLICTPDKKNVYVNVLRTMKREKELPKLEVQLRMLQTYLYV